MGGAHGRGTIFPRPGESTLKSVLLVPGEQDVARHLTIEVDHLGNMFNGVLFAKDPQEPDVIYRLYTALRNCLNQDLQDVGNVEVDL